MKLFSESLMSELNQQLEIVHLETKNPLQYSEDSIKKMVSVMEKLKTHFIKYKFQNKIEEIEFFRNIKPQFAAKLIYYNEIYNIETNKPLGSKKVIRKYYKMEITKLASFFNENLEFYRYYRTGNRCLDNKYFLRGKYDLKLTLDSFYFQADNRFSTSHDYKVAKILANDLIKVFIEEQITKLDIKNENNFTKIVPSKTLKWTGTKVAMVELMYALNTEKVFNNGNLTLIELAKSFETIFTIELGQFNRIYLEIRNRKTIEKTHFLNSLKENLITRMDNADENQ